MLFRSATTLASLSVPFAGRQAALARELTKLHEEVVRGDIAELAELMAARELKGECVVLVGPPAPPTMALDAPEVRARVAFLVETGMSRSDAVRQVAEETGLSRNAVYEAAHGRPD